MDKLKTIYIREEVIKSIRTFFYNRNFHEIIIPDLNENVPLEPNLHPFSTIWETTEGKKRLFLSMSPEKGIKHLLAQGIGNCFSIGKSFRNLENSGSQHIPEFLMLEWYRENADYREIMEDTMKLIMHIKKNIDHYNKRTSSPIINYQKSSIDLTEPWHVLSLSDLFFEFAHLNYEQIINSDKALYSEAEKKGYSTRNATWSELLDQIFVNEIEPKLPYDPFFLVDFPSRISPLCKPQKNKPYLAERFEFYIAGMELGNGNNENTDSDSIRNIFQKEYDKRRKVDPNSPAVDESFLKDLDKMKGKSYAGIGLGIDRLTMILSNEVSLENIATV